MNINDPLQLFAEDAKRLSAAARHLLSDWREAGWVHAED